MKILVKGNIIARGSIGMMEKDCFTYDCGEQDEKDFDLVIYGDLVVDQLFANRGSVFCEGSVTALAMSDEQIKALKGE